jgi:hypothetical protein
MPQSLLLTRVTTRVSLLCYWRRVLMPIGLVPPPTTHDWRPPAPKTPQTLPQRHNRCIGGLRHVETTFKAFEYRTLCRV